MTELGAAIDSIRAADPGAQVTVVWNGVRPVDLAGVSCVAVPENLGVPGGRDLGLRRSAADIVIFLASDRAVRINGAEICADGGWSAA